MTHSMATHVGLEVRFCARFGVYSKEMARFLQKPCPANASSAGRKALASLAKRIMPNRWNPSVSGAPVARSVCPVAPLTRPGPSFKRITGKRTFSMEYLPPMLPCFPRTVDGETAAKTKENKKARLDNHVKPREIACASSAGNACGKGCSLVGWTMDQFCEVCHDSSGPLVPGVFGSSSGSPVGLSRAPLDPPAPMDSDPCSSLPVNTPLHDKRGFSILGQILGLKIVKPRFGFVSEAMGSAP